MGPGGARPFYEAFLERLRAAYEPGKVKDGRFGAMMKVELINGAGTLCLPSFLWSS
jgi:D-tyrosyl-tRNA(Tyr) deacylase